MAAPSPTGRAIQVSAEKHCTNMGSVIRVKISQHYTGSVYSGNNPPFWFLVNLSTLPTIEHLKNDLKGKLRLKEDLQYELWLDGCQLPSWESTLVLRENDAIVIRYRSIYVCNTRLKTENLSIQKHVLCWSAVQGAERYISQSCTQCSCRKEVMTTSTSNVKTKFAFFSSLSCNGQIITWPWRGVMWSGVRGHPPPPPNPPAWTPMTHPNAQTPGQNLGQKLN